MLRHNGYRNANSPRAHRCFGDFTVYGRVSNRPLQASRTYEDGDGRVRRVRLIILRLADCGPAALE
jgi:hypothetical protein